MIRCRCSRCGHRWTPKVAEPVKCPGCKSVYWNRPRLTPAERADRQSRLMRRVWRDRRRS